MNIDQPSNRPIWEAESTHPELAKKVQDALRDVVDPEIGLNIIQLGLIRDLKIEEDQAIIKMILTTPFCPYGPALIDVTKNRIEEAVERPVYINIGNEIWDFSMMEEGLANDWGLY